MTLSAIVLAAVLSPAAQAPPPAPKPAVKSADLAPSATGPTQGFIDAGLAAFRKRHFAQAETEFNKAEESDPQSAAAAFYLGYTIYKRHEHRRNAPEKQKALELFSKAFSIEPGFKPVWGSK
jgi:tetratricopeptide (TPR) repeat protein